MKGHHFGTVDKIKEACTRALMDIPEDTYCDAFNAENLVGNNVLMWDDLILKLYDVLYQYDQ